MRPLFWIFVPSLSARALFCFWRFFLSFMLCFFQQNNTVLASLWSPEPKFPDKYALLHQFDSEIDGLDADLESVRNDLSIVSDILLGIGGNTRLESPSEKLCYLGKYLSLKNSGTPSHYKNEGINSRAFVDKIQALRDEGFEYGFRGRAFLSQQKEWLLALQEKSSQIWLRIDQFSDASFSSADMTPLGDSAEGQDLLKEALARLLDRCAAQELDFKKSYVRFISTQIEENLSMVEALSVYEECLRQTANHPTSSTIALQMKGKIRQKLPLQKDSKPIRKMMEAWTNKTIESHTLLQQALEEQEVNIPSLKENSQFQWAEIRLEQWIEKNSHILNEIHVDRIACNTLVGECQKSVRQYCLWIQDCLPIYLYFKKSIWISGQHWIEQIYACVLLISITQIAFFIFIVLAFLFLLRTILPSWVEQAQKTIVDIRPLIGRVTKDSPLLTLRSFIAYLILSLPLPLNFMAPWIALWLLSPESSEGNLLAQTGLLTCAFYFGLHFIKKLGHSNGFLENHLRFSKEKLQKVFDQWNLLVYCFCLNCFLFLFFYNYPFSSEPLFNLIDRIAFLGMALCAIALKFKLARAKVPILPWGIRKNSGNGINSLAWFIFSSVTGYTILAAIYGYFETAQSIFFCLEKILLSLSGLLFAYHLILQVMLLHKKRIAFQQSLKKRKELLSGNHSVVNDCDELGLEEKANILDLETLSSKSLNLMNAITNLSSILIFWILCPDWQPMLYRLETSVFASPFTLSSLLKWASVFFLLIQLYLNLPSALDLLVFPHLQLPHYTRYKIKVLSRYLLIFLACLIAWKKVEPLAEYFTALFALMVGAIGFGLRDLVCSFFSGLIILFFKTVQLGDIVNIGSFTGVVTHINIITTTLIDAEKKEFSIPNKNLVNENFSRWPSEDMDIVNRITLKISLPSRCAPSLVFQLLNDAISTMKGISENSKENITISEISNGILVYEIILFVEDLQHQALVRSSLYEEILNRSHLLGITQNELSIHS